MRSVAFNLSILRLLWQVTFFRISMCGIRGIGGTDSWHSAEKGNKMAKLPETGLKNAASRTIFS